MSNIPVTFFRDRSAGGETYRFDVGWQAHVRRFHVYSRRRLEGRKLKNRDAKGKDEANDVLSDLRSLLADKGGIVAIVTEEREPQGSRRLNVFPVSAKGDDPPQNFGVLRPGYPLVFEAVSEKEIKLHPGSHVLVPVDAQAEEQLDGLRRHLAFLPADLEALVLNALRKPSLDSRLERLEAKVFPREAAGGGDGGRGWLRASAARLRSPLARAAVLGTLSVLLLLLAGGGYLYWRHRQSQSGSLTSENPSETSPTAVVDPATGAVSEPVTPERTAPSDDSAETWRQLFAAAEQSRDPRIAKVYGQHFLPSGERLLVAGGLAQLLGEKGQSDAKRDEARQVMWGVVKLAAMRLAGEQALPSGFLETTDPQPWTVSKEALRLLDTQGLLAEPWANSLLAFLLCEAVDGTVPQIPATQNGADASFVLSTGSVCADASPATAVLGAAELTGFVQIQR